MSLEKNKRCAWCGEIYLPGQGYKKYCSKTCFNKANHYARDIPDSERSKGDVIRTFHCRNCNKQVYVTDPKDRRTVFCCNSCQRKHWKYAAEKRMEVKMNNDKVVAFKIIRQIGVLSERDDGWKKEINFVSWNNNPPKFDIRTWSPDHYHMTRGITLTAKEINVLANCIDKLVAVDEEQIHKDEEFEM